MIRVFDKLGPAILTVSISIAIAPRVTAATYNLNAEQNTIIGSVLFHRVGAKDDFASIALSHQIGFDALVAANPGVNPWYPGTDKTIYLPMQHILPDAEHDGIVVNLPEKRMYYFDHSHKKVHTFPVGIGRTGWETPIADTRVTTVQKNPVWRPPQSVIDEYRSAGLSLPSVVPAGPDNPLGDRVIRLELPGYLLHGTNNPEGVGLRVSHGCIRLYPADIRQLAELVAPGTRVQIINQPVKWAQSKQGLQLEAHRPLSTDRPNKTAGYAHLVKHSPRLKNWLVNKRNKQQLFSGMPQSVPNF